MNIHQFPSVGNTPILESTNYDETSTILTKLIGPHKSQLTGPHTNFFTRFYHAELYQSSMLYIQWCGGEILTRTQPDNLYILYIPLEGLIQEKINSCLPIYSSSEKAHIFTPEQDLVGTLSTRGQGISVCMPHHLVQGELTKLLNNNPHDFVDFDPELDLTTFFGQSLKQIVLFAWQETQNRSLFLPQLEQTLLTGLLQYQSHNYSAALQFVGASLSQQQVCLAKEFIEANLENPISLGDISEAVGVSARSLQRAFTRHCDCSPMQFLTQLRLDAIHRELKQGKKLGNITNLMLKYQFNHLGRCSQSYQKRFGELPSQTVRRSHRLE
ncbi:MAG: AraC family transcriptional regulator [Microcoleaceae cyanobacterium]